ncbi:hypothetical protein TB2_037565 [Malus domestica]
MIEEALEPLIRENRTDRRDCIGNGQQFQAARPSAETRGRSKGNLSQVILQLKSHIERLTAENDSLSEPVEESKNLRAESEQVKKSSEEAEMRLQRGNADTKRKCGKNELVSTISVLKKEAEKSLKVLNRMRHLKDEKEATVGLLKSEIEELKARCRDFKRVIYEDEVEKRET